VTNSQATALVTAGSGCIGTAVVEALLARGVVRRVVVADRAQGTGKLPDGAGFVHCDLRDPGQVDALAESLPGELTVLVNVLGGERRPPVAPVTDVRWPPAEVWDDIVDLNLSSVYRITRAVVDRLVPGSAICNVSSIAAAMPWAVSPAYGAAKAALEHWSNSLAVLLAERAIRVNTVRPGFVWSSQWAAVDRTEFERVVRDRVPLRQARPNASTDREQIADDIAAAVAFLCSDDARQLTGQAIGVDGGAALVRAAR